MKIVIVGAGLAGLTAAYTLLKQGRAAGTPFEVALLESDTAAGGQARAFPIQPKGPDGGDLAGEPPFVVEHGSHVFFQFYDTIIKLIDELRADPALAADMPGLAPVPGWTIVDAYGNVATMSQGPVLPEPFNVFPSMLDISWLPLLDRLRVGIGALSVLHHTYADMGKLDQMTSKELALASGYTEMGAVAWNSASLGLTNLFIQEQSGALFYAKHKVLIDYPNGLSYKLPAGDLGKLVAEPMLAKIRAWGGTIEVNAAVTGISRPDGQAKTEVTYTGVEGSRTIVCDQVILAIAPSAAAPLVPWVKEPWTALQKVTPVLTVVVRLSGELQKSATDDREYGLSREQWVFSVATNLSKFWPEYEGIGKTVLRFEIGHADLLPEGPDTPDDAILKMIETDLPRLFPEVAERGLTVEAYAIHRETVRLYTRWVKGAWSMKPTERDVGQGVYLAGDWTTKGTIGMEAAVNSGVEAANFVLARAGMPPVPFRDVPL
jgi:protoporphyrinogen oxidase